MRVLCLLFPRLGVQLALRVRPALRDRGLVLLQGHGDDALVAGVTCDGAARGLLRGMTAAEARRRCPGAAFIADNAADCLDELERVAAILRTRATPLVAPGGRDHLFLDISKLANGERDEARLAQRLAGVAGAWSGCDVRAGVASSRREALEAAMTARRGAVVCPPMPATEPAIAPFRAETLSADVTFPGGANELAVRARAARLLRQLDVMLEARGQSYRSARVIVVTERGEREVRVRPPSPAHDASRLERQVIDAQGGDGSRVFSVHVELGGLGPSVRVTPSAASAAVGALRGLPVAPTLALRRAG